MEEKDKQKEKLVDEDEYTDYYLDTPSTIMNHSSHSSEHLKTQSSQPAFISRASSFLQSQKHNLNMNLQNIKMPTIPKLSEMIPTTSTEPPIQSFKYPTLSAIQATAPESAIYMSHSFPIPPTIPNSFLAVLPNKKRRVISLSRNLAVNKKIENISVLFKKENFQGVESGWSFLEFCRIFHPIEIELSCWGGCVGVFKDHIGYRVLWASVDLNEELLTNESRNVPAYGDVVVKANGEELLQDGALGKQSKRLKLYVLRKGLSIAERCPQGHILLEKAPSVNKERHCSKGCEVSSSEVWFLCCTSCPWSVCGICARRINEGVLVEKNVNTPPFLVSEKGVVGLEEKVGARLSFTLGDVGSKVRVYNSFEKDCGWWVGEIRDYLEGIGHTVVYENVTEETLEVSKELVSDFSWREYQIVDVIEVDKSAKESPVRDPQVNVAEEDEEEENMI
eukprot:snap_masked-scaffold_8-processed-gene-8.54-mRNA-1 protein AED:1.00 eAED:1.00 QI:0/-1/0/0/-1/1/1/0/448